MKVSLIITTKNEEKSIAALLDSIKNQSEKPDEIIIADAKSSDATLTIIQSFVDLLPITIIHLQSDANRAVGRNSAIHCATHEHILITDAGCTLNNDWVKYMKTGFVKAPVVAGFYKDDSLTIFEKCVAAYVLIMPDRLNVQTFLPATRSMGITKSAWERVGKFNESLRESEDYTFARIIRDKKIPIHVVPKAIVYWRPRKNFSQFYTMIYLYAFGDAFAHTLRPKVIFIFLRYLLFIILGVASGYSIIGFFFFVQSLALYVSYSILKNYHYINSLKALFYLPLLQISSDVAVMAGTIKGIYKHQIEK